MDEPSAENKNGNKNKKAIAAFLVVLAVLIVAGLVGMNNRKQSDVSRSSDNPAASTTPASPEPAPATDTQPTATASGTYKDGSYSATDSYNSPGGVEEIKVDVTVRDDVVTAAAVQQDTDNPQAQEYQDKFKQNFAKLVIGKKLSDIELNHVSGSSLTSGGFNDALEQIKTQAGQS
ncbi:MAG TPA: hypothetical protein VF572_06835 [Candidatus Saccharimonadales bacterium]|jgi:uncharacterized protein with FMN-binding domain